MKKVVFAQTLALSNASKLQSSSRRLRSLGHGAAGVILLTAASASPTYAAQERVAQCPCASGYVWRVTDGNDFVCVTPDSRTTAEIENQQSILYKTGPNNSDTCVSGYVWRDAFNGDGVCVEPSARSRVHAENARHTGQNTKFEVQDPYSHCYLK